MAAANLLLLATSLAQTGALPLLAQSDSPSLGRMIIPVAVLIMLAGALLAVLSVVRRRMHQQSEPVPGGRGFSLSDLRQLHREGKMTDEEFERAKALLVNSVQSALKKDAKPSPHAEPLNSDLKR